MNQHVLFQYLLHFHWVSPFGIFPPANGRRGVWTSRHGTGVGTVVPVISPCGCEFPRGQGVRLALHGMFRLHRKAGHGRWGLVEGGGMREVPMLAVTQASGVVDFTPLVRKNGGVQSWMTGWVERDGWVNFGGAVEASRRGTWHGASSLGWLWWRVEFNMAHTVYPAMLVAIKAVTRIAAEVGRGFAGIVGEKALADLTSCDNVYRSKKKIFF